MQYRACTLIDGVLAGQVLDLGAVKVVPVAGAGAVHGHVGAVNAALDELGWPSRLSADQYRDGPALLCLSGIDADDGTAAVRKHLAEVSAAVTAMTVLRGGEPRLLVTAVEALRPEGWQADRSVDHRPPYAGNLLTGPFSGEDPALLRRYASAARKPVVALWLGLAREAAAQRSSEAQLFRFAQLLEIMAAAHDSVDPGLAEDGSPLAWRGGNTNGVEGSTQRRILVLLRDAAAHRQVHLPSLLPPGLTDVWLGVRCLIGVRNAVAHHGGFDPASPAQKARTWYVDVAEFMAAGRLAEPLLDPRDHLAQSAREMARLVLAEVVDKAFESPS